MVSMTRKSSCGRGATICFSDIPRSFAVPLQECRGDRNKGRAPARSGSKKGRVNITVSCRLG
jgi:hypothetical protein